MYIHTNAEIHISSEVYWELTYFAWDGCCGIKKDVLSPIICGPSYCYRMRILSTFLKSVYCNFDKNNPQFTVCMALSHCLPAARPGSPQPSYYTADRWRNHPKNILVTQQSPDAYRSACYSVVSGNKARGS